VRRFSGWLLGPALALLFSHSARADVLSVGPSGSFAAPCAAFAAAADGDSIEIDPAGQYLGDVCGISKNQLKISGKGGLAKIDAGGMNAQGKAIWVVQGDDTTIEGIEFTGAKVPDLNGAGIRQEGKNLTVRHCYFHDNEDGILAGDGADSEILIEHSEFDHNGAGDGYSHNLYINHVKKLTFRYNWSHRSVIGHLLKSRAAESYVLYNRITGEADGTSSYELDFPNGGKTYVIGNLIEQGPKTDNPSILAYIEEGANAANPSHQLYVVNNTFVNDKGSGTFLNIAADAAPSVVANNVFFGGGTPANQAAAMLSHNYTDKAPCLVDAAAFDYHLMAATPCVDGGADAGDGDGFSLTPAESYVHPAGSAPRTSVGSIDIGAYELGGEGLPEGGTAIGGAANGGTTTGGTTTGGAATGGTNSSSAGTAPSAGAPAGGTPVTANSPKTDSSCSCRLARSHSASPNGPALALALALALAHRRRRHALITWKRDRLSAQRGPMLAP
jgi:MYXO-CTERM domain-containing protein